jgi:quercetin dioxygenase-like cupin family protein
MQTIDPARMVTRAGEEERISFLGMELFWKVTSEMSRGKLLMFEHLSGPGTGVPLHVHNADEEIIHVLSGRVLAQIGDTKVELGAGDIANLPRGVQHAWRVIGDEPARLMFTVDLAPESDYETMFNSLVGLEPTQFEELKAICAANNADFVEPPTMP